MSSITIRNVPDSVKSKLADRAEASGESLEAHIRRTLAKEAGETTGETWADLIRRLAKEASELPPSEEEGFDFDRLYLRNRSRSSLPLEFDWWPGSAKEGEPPST
jgi:plasmid stability protein